LAVASPVSKFSARAGFCCADYRSVSAAASVCTASIDRKLDSISSRLFCGREFLGEVIPDLRKQHATNPIVFGPGELKPKK
jgi:hypothetical protein